MRHESAVARLDHRHRELRLRRAGLRLAEAAPCRLQPGLRRPAAAALPDGGQVQPRDERDAVGQPLRHARLAQRRPAVPADLVVVAVEGEPQHALRLRRREPCAHVVASDRHVDVRREGARPRRHGRGARTRAAHLGDPVDAPVLPVLGRRRIRHRPQRRLELLHAVYPDAVRELDELGGAVGASWRAAPAGRACVCGEDGRYCR